MGTNITKLQIYFGEIFIMFYLLEIFETFWYRLFHTGLPFSGKSWNTENSVKNQGIFWKWLTETLRYDKIWSEKACITVKNVQFVRNESQGKCENWFGISDEVRENYSWENLAILPEVP